ncbi:hypothetical protein CPB84DRAFT_1828908 [Gymnopilus junonius]|uniref:Uncharacterized protein n=1 Tax=Gymnopilus junonius TaxID=109634 RepID=A0A9P5NBF6_GYMJU|nr:hypothetical protein CPB84DRAFT_1828908 [Gymnopilus junonius]
MEIAAEEAEALKMTEEQRQALLKPFATVKAEFTDLDGLRWTQSALYMLSPRSPQRRAPPHVPPNTPADVLSPKSYTNRGTAFNVLTKADLDTISPDATIRPSFSSSSSLVDLGIPNGNANRHRDGSHSRSPIKGLFSTTSQQPLDMDTPSRLSTTDHVVNPSPLQTPCVLRCAVEMEDEREADEDEGDSRVLVPPGLHLTPAPTPYSSPDPAAATHTPQHLPMSPPSSPTKSLLDYTSTPLLSSASLQTDPTLISLPSTPSHQSTVVSPRSRLRSLLQDDYSSSTIRAPSSPTPTPPALDPGNTPAPSTPSSRRPSLYARPPSRLDLNFVRRYEDGEYDETPMPSPISSPCSDLH